MSQLNIHPDFRKLFYQKEGRELLGHKYRNIWVLVGIMFLTFVAIGFANGSLAYLEEKMDDPFIKWVSIEVPNAISDKVDKIKEILDREDTKKRYHYIRANANLEFLLRFQNQTEGGTFPAQGRTIELTNPILEEILNEENLISGQAFRSETDIGLIVTEKLLDKFGYPPDAQFIHHAFSVYEDGSDAYLPLPIIAVVRKLPSKKDFATTPFFYSQRKIGLNTGNPFNPFNTKELLFFIPTTDEDKAYAFKEALENFTSESLMAEYGSLSPFVGSPGNPDYAPYQEGKLVNISFLWPDDSTTTALYIDQELKKLTEMVLADAQVKTFNPVRLYDYSIDINADIDVRYDRLAIHFENLDHIRVFRDTFLLGATLKSAVSVTGEGDLGLDIDMAQIEAKENYNFVSKLTRIISLILIAFSVLSICLFVSHLFRRHLDKISRNIGTFKAFGIDNKTLITTYLRMIGAFILGATGISLILAWLFGNLHGIRLILFLLSSQGRLEAGQSYFQLLNVWTLLAIILLVSISMLVLYRTAKTMLSRTPGNLIYNR